MKKKINLENLRKNKNETLRPVSTGLEKILYKPIKVLDKGFIRVVDYMGNDSSIVQAARVSYGRGTKKKNQDIGLIRYLLRHRHTTPFEMCEIKLHVKLPIFIARQWIRHRTANVNEYSARYSILEDEFYIPKKQHLSSQSNVNKQGRADELDDKNAREVLKRLKQDAIKCYEDYTWMLNDRENEHYDKKRPSMAREIARINLTLNTYTEWYWKIDLHNFMHFINLRADYHSQYEIREYGKKLLFILKNWTPITFKAYMSYRQNSVELSEEALEVIKNRLKGKKVKFENSSLSKREWDDLMNTFT